MKNQEAVAGNYILIMCFSPKLQTSNLTKRITILFTMSESDNTMYLYSNGRIVLRKLRRTTLKCAMYFAQYPKDKQACFLDYTIISSTSDLLVLQPGLPGIPGLKEPDLLDLKSEFKIANRFGPFVVKRYTTTTKRSEETYFGDTTSVIGTIYFSRSNGFWRPVFWPGTTVLYYC